MENKLEMRLEVWGTSVVVQILGQDKRFTRQKGEDEIKEYKCANGLKIYSDIKPGLYYHSPTHSTNFNICSIALRGAQTNRDYDVITVNLPSEEEAKNFKDCILNGLLEWSIEYPEFKSSGLPIPNANIYTF